jgi:hypothetical protein
MPDEEAGVVFERGVDDVVIIAVHEDAGVRIVAREDEVRRRVGRDGDCLRLGQEGKEEEE